MRSDPHTTLTSSLTHFLLPPHLFPHFLISRTVNELRVACGDVWGMKRTAKTTKHKLAAEKKVDTAVKVAKTTAITEILKAQVMTPELAAEFGRRLARGEGTSGDKA